jgi:hypothetical protein
MDDVENKIAPGPRLTRDPDRGTRIGVLLGGLGPGRARSSNKKKVEESRIGGKDRKPFCAARFGDSPPAQVAPPASDASVRVS